jgi:EKC/KEOPS complex subunit PCC1/LAGE3
LQALRVDKELSPLVHRDFTIVPAPAEPWNGSSEAQTEKTVLRTEYKATTNRMLRVAVNGFMESLTVVLAVMEELDLDILEANAPL